MKKARITIHVTKTLSARAQVTPTLFSGDTPFSVTIGGKAWKEGKGKAYQPAILKKYKDMIFHLEQNLEHASKITSGVSEDSR